MEFIFFTAADQLLFSRSDMEEGHWIQQEMQVTAVFPFLESKIITRGMRIGFRDPATDNLEVFEIRNVQNIEPDHYQQITAEHIAISELSDEHINTTEITDKTPTQALQTVLAGVSYWSIGNVTASNVSSCDIGRGSVWEAIKTIEQNWNVYCIPRVTIGAGGITGKYIDIVPAGGTFRGVRLSIRKNMSDSTVTYDDTDVLTALYGYGGTIDKAQSSGDDQKAELTFAGVTWTATDGHPAKPAGQTYLEWPEKTALYGRNGRPRFGYYQNGDIKDAAILLQKTWEALQQTCEPKIRITGTVTDLYRLGYKDQPMRIHDIAIVEIEETGELFHREIITLDVDLVDPTGNLPEIGDYISNIIYINRETNSAATTGGRGGGGGGRGQSNSNYNESETATWFEKNDQRIAMVVGTRNGGYYIKSGEIALAINKSGTSGSYESTATINANHVNISATDDVYTLAGDLEHDANGRLVIKNAGGLYVRRTESGTTAEFGIWDRGNLTGGVMVTQINGQSNLKLSADVIDIDGVVTSLTSKNITVGGITAGSGDFRGCNIDALQIQGYDFGICSFTVDGVLQASFIGDGDVNFDRAAAQREGVNSVYISPSDIIITDSDYSLNSGAPYYDVEIEATTTSSLFPTLSSTSSQIVRVSATQAYQDGRSAGASAVSVTLDTGSWTAIDASTGDYRRTVTAKKDGSAAATDTISAQQIWNLGWNACRAWVLDHAHTVLSGYSSWNSGNAAALYVAPTGGAQMATGQTQRWRYGGTVTTYYSAPSSK